MSDNETHHALVRRTVDGGVLRLTIQALSLDDMKFAPHVRDMLYDIRMQIAKHVFEAITEYNKK